MPLRVLWSGLLAWCRSRLPTRCRGAPPSSFARHVDDRDHEAIVSRLAGLTFAHPDVPAFERAPLTDAELAVHVGETNVFVLSTCLRVEIVWSGGPELAPDVLGELYGFKTFPEGKLRTEQALFHHLCRVAAGLESALVGETEVFAQFRQAVRGYVDGSSAGNELARLLKTVVAVGRTARKAYDYVMEDSLANAAARLAESAPRVAILGGGAMAKGVAQELDDADVVVLTRRPVSVGGLASRPWTELPETLAESPVVVSTVPGPVLDDRAVDVIRRRSEPLLMVDLGMPPALGAHETIDSLRYLGIDDVASSIESSPASHVEDVTASEAQSAWHRLTVSDRAGSIITSMVERAEQTVEEEVSRFINRLSAGSDSETVLHQLAHTVARRILHPSLSFVGSTPLAPSELDVVARALGVEYE
jgi:glutamyl-tRNA reductase